VLVRSEIPNEAGEYEEFYAPYDILVYGCGAQSGTFGTPGVREHAFFLKEVDDAIKLRRALVDRFERANMPSVSPEEKIRILSFVVVGGGPTGVEWSGEFSDFLKRDLAKVSLWGVEGRLIWTKGCSCRTQERTRLEALPFTQNIRLITHKHTLVLSTRVHSRVYMRSFPTSCTTH